MGLVRLASSVQHTYRYTFTLLTRERADTDTKIHITGQRMLYHEAKTRWYKYQ
jgi:hypothetical protein